MYAFAIDRLDELIGEKLNACVRNARRYEIVRKLSPREFLELVTENIRTGKPFDDLVDGMAEAMGVK